MFPVGPQNSPPANLPLSRCCGRRHRLRVFRSDRTIRDTPRESVPLLARETCSSRKAPAAPWQRRPKISSLSLTGEFPRTDLFVDLVFAHEQPERISGGRETVRDAHALFFKRANHLAKSGILAADAVAVLG